MQHTTPEPSTGNNFKDGIIYLINLIVFGVAHSEFWDVLDKTTKVLSLMTVCISLFFMVKKILKEIHFKK